MPHSIPKGLSREHVLKALDDLDAGIEHPFGPSTGYVVVHRGKRYSPKAVIGIAFRHLTGEILHHSRFSGGEAPGQANSELRRLGFTVVEKVDQEELPAEESQSKAWSEDEVGFLIADYFDMLKLDLRGGPLHSLVPLHGVLQQQQRELWEDDVEPVTREIIERGQRLTAFDLIGARMTFHRASRLMAEFQLDYDVILTPTLGQIPVPHGQMSLSGTFEDYVSGLAAFQPFTPLANATGQPAMSVPLHWADGLPVGVQFMSRFGDEVTLFRLAAELEQARPWANQRAEI